MLREPVLQDRASLEILLQRAAARLAAQGRLSDSELAMIIEKHRGKALPAAITDYLTRHFRGEIRGVKGPKRQSDVVKEFRFGPAANLYDRVLPIFEYLAGRRKRLTLRRRHTVTDETYRDETLAPNERAFKYVLDKPPEPNHLGNIDFRTLANAVTQWRGKMETRDFPDDDPNAHPTDQPNSNTSAK